MTQHQLVHAAGVALTVVMALLVVVAAMTTD
jgi:hypothetical protein